MASPSQKPDAVNTAQNSMIIEPKATAPARPPATQNPTPQRSWKDAAFGFTQVLKEKAIGICKGVGFIGTTMYTDLMRVGKETGTNIVANALDQFLAPARLELEDNIKAIFGLADPEMLRDIINGVVPDIAEFLSKQHPALSVIYKSSPEAMQTGIKILLCNASARLIEATPAPEIKPNETKARQKTFFDVLAFTLGLMEKQYERLKPRLEKAGSDKKARDKILAELLDPIFAIAFPKGKESLGFNPNALHADSLYRQFGGTASITDEAWNNLRNELPELVVNILNSAAEWQAKETAVVIDRPDGQMELVAIKALTPWIVSMAAQHQQVANSFHAHCPTLFSKAIEFALTTFSATAIRKSNNATPSSTHTLAYIAGEVQRQYRAHHSEIVDAEHALHESDVKAKLERNHLICTLFTPLVNLADPTANAVDVNEQTPAAVVILQALTRKVWGSISPQLPEVGVKIYDLCMDSHAAVANRDAAMQTTEEWTALRNVAVLVADVAITRFKADPTAIERATDILVKRVPDRSSEMPNGEWAKTVGAFRGFLLGLARSVLSSKARALTPLLPFLQGRISDLTAKAFFHMEAREQTARKREGHYEPTDAISLIMSQVRKLLTSFYLKNGIELRDSYHRIACLSPDNADRIAWINQIFLPFSVELLEMTGLSNEPLFGLQESIKAYLPHLLFDLYGSLIKSEPNLVLWIDPHAALESKKREMRRSPLGQFWIQVAERMAHGQLTQLPEQLKCSLAHDIAQASASKFCDKINHYNVEAIIDEALQRLKQLFPKWYDSHTPPNLLALRQSLVEDCMKWLGKRTHKADHPTSHILSEGTRKLLPPASDRSFTAFTAWLFSKLEGATSSYLTPSSHWTKTVNEWLTESLKSLADHSAASVAQSALHELRTKAEPDMREWVAALPEATLLQIKAVIASNLKQWLAQTPRPTTQKLINATFGAINRITHGEFAQKLPTSDPSEWNWIWLEAQANELATKYAYVEPLWDFVEAHLQSTLLNSFAQSNMGAVVASCATKAHTFIHEHNETISLQYADIARCNKRILDLDTQFIHLDTLHPSNDVEKERHELLLQKKRVLHQRETHITALTPTFKVLARDLLQLFGVDKEPKLVVFGAFEMIIEKAARVLCQSYVEMISPSEGYEVTFDRMCSMFFDQKLFQHKLLSQGISQDLVQLMSDPSTMLAEKRIELWRVSEASVMARQVENVIRGVAAPYIRKLLQTLAKRYDMQEWLKVSFDIEVSPAESKLLRKEMQKFADHKAIGEYLELLVNTTLPQALVNTIATIERMQNAQSNDTALEPQHHLHYTPYLIVKNVLFIFDKHLAVINDRQDLETRIADAEKESNVTVKREKLRNIFLPVAKDLLALIGNNLHDPKHPAYHWPLPMYLKALFWTSLFPNVMADMMLNGNKSLNWNTRQLRTQQEELYKSKHPIVVAEVSGRFAQSFIPHMLAANAPQRAQEFCNSVEVLSRNSEVSHIQQFHSYWQANQPSIESVLASNSQQLGDNREDPFKHALEWLRDKVEAFVLTAIGQKSNTLANIERHRKGFMMDMMADTMKLVASHAERVNEVARANGKSHPHQVDPLVMRRAFGSQLHPALRVPDDLSAAEEEKLLAEQKMTLFIRPLTEKLLYLAGVSSKLLPEPLFQQLKNTLAPVMCSIMYDATWTRQSGKNIQITFVTKWREAIRSALQQQATGIVSPPKNAHVDPKDIAHFQTIAAPLLKELVDWLPGTLVNIMIHNLDGVHRLSAEMLTNIAVDQAQQWNTIELMRKMMIVAGPSMQPGAWTKRQPNAADDKDPKDVLVPSEQISFPRSDEEKEKSWRQRVERAYTSESEATSMSVHLGIESINATIRTFALTKIWMPVTYGIEYLAGKVFRSYGQTIALTMKNALEYIGKLLSYMLYPLYLMLIYPTEWIHISIQERNLDRSASMPVNESLFMKLIELWINGAVAIKEEMERAPVKAEFKPVLDQLVSNDRPPLRPVVKVPLEAEKPLAVPPPVPPAIAIEA